MFGAGGGTSSYREAEETDLIVLWGSNARETHPIFFHHLLRGVRNGARLYAVDPRRTSSAEWADVWLGLDVGSDIALANAIGREIIAAGLEDKAFIERATSVAPYYVGKPNPLMVRTALRTIDAHSEDTVMIGDRMDTDIIMGIESGLETILVLTGVTTRAAVARFPYQPTRVVESVADLEP